MSWIACALIGMTIWSATAVADRYFLLRVKSARFYVVLPTLLQLPLMLLVLLYFPLKPIDFFTFSIAIGSGILEAAILYYLFVAVSSEEISRVFPLTGLGPVLTMLFTWAFWSETPSSAHIVAMLLFIAGGIILTFKRSSAGFRMSRALLPIAMGSVLTSAFMLSLSFSVTETDFWTGFFYSRIGFFLAGVGVLFFFKDEILRQWRSISSGLKMGLLTNQAIAFTGHLFYFFSLSLASAALVQATLSMQSGIIFLIALLVSFLSPKLLEESTDRRDIAQKLIGIALAIAATYLLTMS